MPIDRTLQPHAPHDPVELLQRAAQTRDPVERGVLLLRARQADPDGTVTAARALLEHAQDGAGGVFFALLLERIDGALTLGEPGSRSAARTYARFLAARCTDPRDRAALEAVRDGDLESSELDDLRTIAAGSLGSLGPAIQTSLDRATLTRDDAFACAWATRALLLALRDPSTELTPALCQAVEACARRARGAAVVEFIAATTTAAGGAPHAGAPPSPSRAADDIASTSPSPASSLAPPAGRPPSAVAPSGALPVLRQPALTPRVPSASVRHGASTSGSHPAVRAASAPVPENAPVAPGPAVPSAASATPGPLRASAPPPTGVAPSPASSPQPPTQPMRGLVIGPEDGPDPETFGLLRLADAAIADGDWDDAVELLERGARRLRDPVQRAERYFQLGSIEVDELDNPAHALEHFLVSFICVPESRTLERLESLYRRTGRLKELVGAYEIALADRRRRAPSQVEALLLRKAQIEAQELDRPERAAETLLEVIGNNPRDRFALDILVSALADRLEPATVAHAVGLHVATLNASERAALQRDALLGRWVA